MNHFGAVRGCLSAAADELLVHCNIHVSEGTQNQVANGENTHSNQRNREEKDATQSIIEKHEVLRVRGCEEQGQEGYQEDVEGWDDRREDAVILVALVGGHCLDDTFEVKATLLGII